MQATAKSAPRRALTVAAALTGALACMLPLANSAAAHGSIVDPASRNYGCWERWGDDHLNENMAQEDPMCWQAWQDNPNAMWNWNGLYKNNVNGNHEAHVSSGNLCSGGDTQNGRYSSLDTPGAWKTTDITDNFTMNLYDQAQHGADYFKVYVSKNSYDPTSEPLGWEDLDLVKTTGSYAPAENTTFQVNTSGYDGRHVIFTIWKASHMDQNYYICSDVNFA
ncbi:lytic polysaccharide monooxygenase auxiliary activity family 9 protein [Streptomonospora litoralis]|uniref:Chitin binding domain protein n=1 Tax=Streptomonospora litoralis TaxID=2498135 RepID=A0A4V0ZJ97_9ACTN|nr:lytic polysaccharide monooxygenase auxiliary activity family 9 protein [Streptomonospora litoralis]QBI52722.1 Chitin binding domain protein [Streptomonospora litoralis]